MIDRNWPHPVLDPSGIDYPKRAFQGAVKVRHAGGAYVIDVSLECGSDTLQSAIASGDAAYAIRIHCPLTSYRRLFKSSEKQITANLPDKELLNTFTVRPYVVALRPFQLRTEECAPLFAGLTFELGTGFVLAVAPEQEYCADKSPDAFRSIHSIFTVVKSHDAGAKHLVYDFEHERIMILLPEGDFARYQVFRDRSPYKQLLIPALVLPGLEQGLQIIRRDGEENDSTRWRRVLRRKLRDMGAEEYDEQTAFSIAQDLLDQPVSRAFQAVLTAEETQDE